VSRRRLLRLLRAALKEVEYAQFEDGEGWRDFHLEKARELLGEAIYLLRGGDG